MPHTIADRTRSIAKQTLLGMIATLAVVAGASVALAADGGDEEPAPVVEETEEPTCLDDGATVPDTDDGDAVDGHDSCGDEPTSTTFTDNDEGDDLEGNEGTENEGAENEAGDGDERTEVPEVDDSDGETADETDGEYRNHGEAVSKAAREDCAPGPGHGACVSKVARSDAGKDRAEESTEDVEPEPSAGATRAPATKPGKGVGHGKSKTG